MGTIDQVFDNYSFFIIGCVDGEKGKLGDYHVYASDGRDDSRSIDVKCHKDLGCNNKRCYFYQGRELTSIDLTHDSIEALKSRESITYQEGRNPFWND